MSPVNLRWKAVTTVFLTSAILTVAFHAHAGPSDGGGGGAYICRNKNGKILSAELIDLWEGRNRPARYESAKAYRLNIPYTDEPVNAQLDRALDKLKVIDPHLAQSVSINLDYVRTHIEDLDDSEMIELPPDANLIYGKAQCPAEGMMYFDGDTQNLSRKHKLFEYLKVNHLTNEAAAWMHEALYKSWREISAVSADSTEVRKTVACLFAKDDCFGLSAATIPFVTDRINYLCHSLDYDFQLVELKRTPEPAAGGINVFLKAIVHRIGSTAYPVPLVGERKSYLGRNDMDGGGSTIGAFWFKNLIGTRFPERISPYYTITGSAAYDTVTTDTEYYITSMGMSSKTLLDTGEIIPAQQVKCERVKAK